MTITDTEYGNFQIAFDHFNKELFGGKLPPCLITLQRRKHTLGYYSPHRFKGRVNKQFRTDEIALNPATFEGRTDEDILSTLVHEMSHQYQRIYGNPGRGRYHNREWADLMFDLGLMPSNTGKPGGKQTGDSMSHYVIKKGRFQRSCQKLLATGFKLNWQSVETRICKGPGRKAKNGHEDQKPKPVKDRQKFTCPKCELNAWAKPSAILMCGICYQESQAIQKMQSYWDHDFEDWTDEALAKLGLLPGF